MISGKSGSGKSSVHNLLLRFYDPTEGRITYNGRDIRDFSVETWRSMMGVVPQVSSSLYLGLSSYASLGTRNQYFSLGQLHRILPTATLSPRVKRLKKLRARPTAGSFGTYRKDLRQKVRPIFEL